MTARQARINHCPSVFVVSNMRTSIQAASERGRLIYYVERRTQLLQPDDKRFREVFNTLESYIERRYGVPVIISDVPDPFTGDLDGSEIHVDYANDVEASVFIIAHLFGHTVQWNLSEYARQIGYEVQKNP